MTATDDDQHHPEADPEAGSEAAPGSEHGTEHGDDRTDPDLASLVQLVDAYGLEYSVVLTLAGQVLDGTLLAARRFATQVADVVQGPDPDDTLRGALADSFRSRAEALQSWGASSKLGHLDPESQENDLRSMPDVEFVHLRDVRVSSRPDAVLPLWRGRISDVVGWTLTGWGDAAADEDA